MPLIWRYLLIHYLRVLGLCVGAFIAILLTTRFDDIAHFACLGSNLIQIVEYVGRLLLYILPIAIPISALIAVVILFSRLSQTEELTAMRASGRSLSEILAPILLAAFALGVGNFIIASELAPPAHLSNSLIKNELRAVNPLLLLNNRRLMQMQGIYCDTLGMTRHGEFVKNLILAAPDYKHGKLAFMMAGSIATDSNLLHGSNISLILSQSSPSEGFDNLIIENIADLNTPSDGFNPRMQKKIWTLQPDHLDTRQLLTFINESTIRRQTAKAYSEFARRISISIAVLSLTLLGAAFSIQVGRTRNHWRFFPMIFLTALFLVAYFLAKGLEDKWMTASILYLLPHTIILATSLRMLYRANKGYET